MLYAIQYSLLYTDIGTRSCGSHVSFQCVNYIESHKRKSLLPSFIVEMSSSTAIFLSLVLGRVVVTASKVLGGVFFPSWHLFFSLVVYHLLYPHPS